MKKKILSIALVVCIAITAIAGATLAYLQDSDMDKNVMVAGNVKIVQNETDRNGDAYEDGQKLLPAVYDGTLAYDFDMQNTTGDGTTIDIWGETVHNELDKVISVTNKGTEAAYIRTIVLMENNEDNSICEKVHGLWCESDGQYREWLTDDNGNEIMVEIDGVQYSIAVCQYKTAIEAGKTSAPSLIQIFLDPTTTNDWYDLVTDEDGNAVFNILALSQAVQKAGFDSLVNVDDDDKAEHALNTAFGEVTAENVAAWFDGKVAYTTGDANVIGGNDSTTTPDAGDTVNE